MIRDAHAADDAARIAAIYEHYVLHDTATFEIEPVTPEQMGARIAGVQGRGLPWVVLEDEDRVLGYAYAAPYRDRVAYRHTLEASVYLDPEVRRGGLGTALYMDLIGRVRRLTDSEHAPVHSLLGGIALPHPASVALHERLGFRHVGTIEDAGWKFDRWIAVGFWQLIL
ncbi:GNAT family N-acetyltransferase [Demequina mangrovi]|uniref:Phosphinothricin acetyltransferase n=1 Tax=Demequina mangrovi TaxID=1043493 RepID=A0A1H7AWH0_9MICO|nr:GNAT family N-acetyltransferase [Demequina mangrovi]SEJ66210.1 phosphinothricin acetyltransferase [Demequina mangrovi]